MSQISLPFDWQGAASGGDFLVSDANAQAVAHLERWRDWPLSVSVLTGPPLSGRSTLARHFAQMSGGSVIDDAQGKDEHALFHAWNAAQTSRQPLLMIGHAPPASWTVALPDLRSRLDAVRTVALQEPDDAVLAVILTRAFEARSIRPPEDLVAFLVRRIDRSAAAAEAVVDRLDALHRPVTRALAASLFSVGESADLFG